MMVVSFGLCLVHYYVSNMKVNNKLRKCYSEWTSMYIKRSRILAQKKWTVKRVKAYQRC